MAELSIGDMAPDFTLPRDGGETVSLSSFKGKQAVVYFYPKDDTSGCTTQATSFTSLAPDFESAGAVIIGISPDTVKSHDKFVTKHGLAIMLGSDEEKTTLEAYGVWKEKSMYGKTYMGVERSTFLVDADGRITAIWRKVKVPGHAEAVLKTVQERATPAA